MPNVAFVVFHPEGRPVNTGFPLIKAPPAPLYSFVSFPHPGVLGTGA